MPGKDCETDWRTAKALKRMNTAPTDPRGSTHPFPSWAFASQRSIFAPNVPVSRSAAGESRRYLMRKTSHSCQEPRSPLPKAIAYDILMQYLQFPRQPFIRLSPLALLASYCRLRTFSLLGCAIFRGGLIRVGLFPYQHGSLPELLGKVVIVDSEAREEELVLVLRVGSLFQCAISAKFQGVSAVRIAHLQRLVCLRCG